jgi:superfamily II DNA or RNA helicase
LITCKKISEGIDIKSVNNIILFSSDRGKLVTTQRIGRCLRTNPENINKIATIVDFVCVDTEKDSNEMEHSADMERSEWLTQLSKTRRI